MYTFFFHYPPHPPPRQLTPRCPRCLIKKRSGYPVGTELRREGPAHRHNPVGPSARRHGVESDTLGSQAATRASTIPPTRLPGLSTTASRSPKSLTSPSQHRPRPSGDIKGSHPLLTATGPRGRRIPLGHPDGTVWDPGLYPDLFLTQQNPHTPTLARRQRVLVGATAL